MVHIAGLILVGFHSSVAAAQSGSWTNVMTVGFLGPVLVCRVWGSGYYTILQVGGEPQSTRHQPEGKAEGDFQGELGESCVFCKRLIPGE